MAPELKLEGVRFRVYRGSSFVRPARLLRPPCAGTPPASPPASSSPSSPGRAPGPHRRRSGRRDAHDPSLLCQRRGDRQPARRRRTDRQRALRAIARRCGPGARGRARRRGGRGIPARGTPLHARPGKRRDRDPGRRTARRGARGKPMTLAAALVLATLAGSPRLRPPRRRPPEAKVSAPARPAVRSTGAARAAPGEGPVRVDADEVHYVFQRREVVFTGKPVVLTRRTRGSPARSSSRRTTRAARSPRRSARATYASRAARGSSPASGRPTRPPRRASSARETRS